MRRNTGGNGLGLTEIGRRLILPSFFLGGDRFMAACYQDSMAIVWRLGKPTLFVTLPRISSDRRFKWHFFKGKLSIIVQTWWIVCSISKLLDELRHICIGKFLATVWTIEYQKSCLPHCHILLVLSIDNSNSLLGPPYINRAVSWRKFRFRRIRMSF